MIRSYRDNVSISDSKGKQTDKLKNNKYFEFFTFFVTFEYSSQYGLKRILLVSPTAYGETSRRGSRPVRNGEWDAGVCLFTGYI